MNSDKRNWKVLRGPTLMYCEAPLSWKYCEAPLSCKYCEAPLSWKSNIEKDDLCLFILIHILSMRNFGMKVEVATFPQLLQHSLFFKILKIPQILSLKKLQSWLFKGEPPVCREAPAGAPPPSRPVGMTARTDKNQQLFAWAQFSVAQLLANGISIHILFIY